MTTHPDPEGLAVVRWRHDGVGIRDWYVASSGSIVMTDGDRVYVADGFGGQDPEQRVTALESSSGEIIWQRADLASGLSGVPFLQTLWNEALIVNGQFGPVSAVDVATGKTLWTFPLPSGYGAVASVVANEVLIIAADASGEGDTRPPVVYALSQDGSMLWRTTLAEGTDLQWHPPAAANGLVAVTSTESHPGSAESGNMVHLIDSATGAIRWVHHLGGPQGFHKYPALIDDERVFVWIPGGGVVAIDLSSGDRVWRQPDTRPLALGSSGEIYGVGDGIVVLDPATGDATQLITAQDVQGFEVIGAVPQEEQLIVLGRTGIRGYDLDSGRLTWQWEGVSVVDLPAVTSEFVVVPTGDRAVILIDVP